ncbi:MAG: gliding motility lipoprotein GldB [Bacteroidota bacterium]
MPKKKIATHLLCRRPVSFAYLLFSLLFFGCIDNEKTAEDIAKIKVNVPILRFDQEFAKAIPSDLPRLQRDYPYFFPEQYPDSIWAVKLKDTVQTELLEEVGAAFYSFGEQERDLERFFQHLKYYFPKVEIPKVVTLTSDVDYNNPVLLADSLLLIGLDNYLGSEHKFYTGLPRYIAFGLDKKFLIRDVAMQFAKKIVPLSKRRTFLDRAVHYGKRLYVMDKLIPFVSEARRIGYSEAQLGWAQANEEPLWRYFVERELLYDTDTKLVPRFLEVAPFSKFGLELDRESPGRIGRYLGWQIVRAFMEKNPVSLEQMLHLPADEIFKRSGYKPKRQ